MASVTQRIKQITQPRGGYLKPSEFEKKEFIDNEILNEENIHSSLVGLAVDYLTRLMLDTPPEEAFKISLLGANLIGEERKAYNLLKQIKGIDDSSIYYACKLVGYDVCFRAGPMGYKNVDEIEANTNTINNIKIMIKRSILFFNKCGPITKDGFTFEGGYTKIINSGDGDFLTADTLWDFKVSKNNPTSAHTLQLLIYYIMGIHSIHSEFKTIQKLGIFNPRTNCVYLKKISDISNQIIEEVSSEVIGYVNISNSNNSNYSQTSKPTSENDNLLSMADIMKALSCTRYMVMKYYSEKDLPLVKMNNKYFINRYDLIEWLEKMEAERKRQQMILLVVSVIAIIFVIIFMLFIFNSIGR